MSKKQLSDYEMEILKLLYENRAMTTEQLHRKLNRSMQSVYHKIHILQKEGYLESKGASRIKNYENTNVQGKYAFITDKGITLLEKQGYDCKRDAKRNKPTENQLPYILLTNDLKVDLNLTKWVYLNSIEAKRYFNRRKNELLNGMIRSKETGENYCVYVMLTLTKKEESPSEKYTGMVSYEMSNHYQSMKSTLRQELLQETENSLPSIDQYIYFCKGEEWYEHLIKHIPTIEEGEFITKVKSVRVVPFKIGVLLVRTLATKASYERFCRELVGLKETTHSFEMRFEISVIQKQFGIEFEVTTGETSYYGVNMVDMDLKKMYQLKRYTDYEYERNGKKKIIVFATNINSEILRKEIRSEHVKIEEVHYGNVMELLQSYE